MNKIDIIKPSIFPVDDIVSGVTLKNSQYFGGKGISFSNVGAKIYSNYEVEQSIEMLSNTIGIPQKSLKFQKQVHGLGIQIVDESTGLNLSDGLITNIRGLALAVKIADCAAVLVDDPVNKAIGAFHSGWKGTMLNIVKTGIEIMAIHYGTSPSDLLVYISPCASGKKYEVKWDVAQYFPDSIEQVSPDQYLFDNKKQIREQLTDIGVIESNIEISDICTISDMNYHSYRRDKENSGRMAAFIGMKII
jgi:polyphenol oxidase